MTAVLTANRRSDTKRLSRWFDSVNGQVDVFRNPLTFTVAAEA